MRKVFGDAKKYDFSVPKSAPHHFSNLDGGVVQDVLLEILTNSVCTKATLACMEYGFSELKFAEIIAVIDPKNEPSKGIIRKVAMVPQGTELYRGEILVERYSRRKATQ